MLAGLREMDIWLFTLINQQGRWVAWDLIMPVVSNLELLAPLLGLIVLMVLYWGPTRSRWAILVLAVALSLGDAVTTYVIKPAVGRPRPYATLQLAHVYRDHRWTTGERFPPEATLSFPSNHAVNLAAAAAILVYFFRRRWPIWVGLALLVGYSRVYLGLHYPVDVLAGFLVGVACAGLVLGMQAISARIWPARFTWLTVKA